jgi:GH15 family glucan-1,4-alpha-glucosidase
MLVNFDRRYQVRDLYWPRVGQENHTMGHPWHFGVWADGTFSWTDGDDWERHLDYEEHTLVSRVTLRHAGLGLALLCEDIVDFHEDLYLRQITVTDESGREREVRLFFSHDLHIMGYAVGDSAYYEPERRAVFHYKDKRWFMINVARPRGDSWELGVDQWAVGVKETEGRVGTWIDAEDGELSGNSVAQGSVDSTVAIHLTVPAGGEAIAWYWVAVGEDFRAVTRINRNVRQKGPAAFLDRTRHYWGLWLSKDGGCPAEVSDDIHRLYLRSLLLLRTHIDNEGAIIAATDFDTARSFSDTYAYCWPRDGALIASALIDAGYEEPARRFFSFCHRVISDEGYLLHKFNADGSLASSWHGWVEEGKKRLPVQEDETALVLWALWKHFDRYREVEFIKPLYRGLVIRAANWMAAYRDPATGLPLPSWDLWEERLGIHAWTVGATWGGLQAAANFADCFGEEGMADVYRAAADEIRSGAEKYLWIEDAGHYARMITSPDDGVGGEVSRDQVDRAVDASIAGLWFFGMFDAADERMAATVDKVRSRLWVNTDIGGMARYEGDNFHRHHHEDGIPGNPWFLCTLWLAEWLIATARSRDDLGQALELMQWVTAKALPSGVMAEQVDPHTGEPLSVSPLTWSHAALVTAVLRYRARWAELG